MQHHGSIRYCLLHRQHVQTYPDSKTQTEFPEATFYSILCLQDLALCLVPVILPLTVVKQTGRNISDHLDLLA